MDFLTNTNAIQIANLVFTFGIAALYAYRARQDKETQRLILENSKLTLASKTVSDGNAKALVVVTRQGNENAEAIEHTRIQNVKLASAVEATKVQNDELAEAVGHVHICVEAKAAELKDAVHEVVPAVIKEAIPAAIKEAVPVAVKEVVPDVIKESLPGAIATLKE